MLGYKTDFNFNNIIPALSFYFFGKKFTSKCHQSAGCYFKPCKKKKKKEKKIGSWVTRDSRLTWARAITVERFEKFSLNFSISLFVIRVNLLHL